MSSTFSRAVQPEADASDLPFIVAFDVLQIVGFLLLVPVVLTAWRSPRVQRTSTWFAFVLSWVLSSVAFVIIVGQQTGPAPMAGVCLFQAALIYATPALNAFTAVAYLFQIYFSVHAVVGQGRQLTQTHMRLLHGIPVVVFFAIFVQVIVLGVRNPQDVARDVTGMYCHLKDGTSAKISAGIVIGAMLSMLSLEALTAIILRRNWVAWHRLARTGQGPSLAVLLRVSIFSFLPMVALALGFLSYVMPGRSGGPGVELTLAMLPTAAGLIFGTQKDNLRVWMFWKKGAGGLSEFHQDPSKPPILDISAVNHV